MKPPKIDQEGRVISISFDLGNSQLIGIISVYAITGDGVTISGSSKKKVRQTRSALIKIFLAKRISLKCAQ